MDSEDEITEPFPDRGRLAEHGTSIQSNAKRDVGNTASNMVFLSYFIHLVGGGFEFQTFIHIHIYIYISYHILF